MRYWGSNETVTRGGRSRPAKRTVSPRNEGARAAKTRTAAKGHGRATSGRGGKGRSARRAPAVTSGGSVAPFLRRFYRQQPSVPPIVQKALFFLGLAALIYAFVLGESGAVRIAMLRAERAREDAHLARLEATRAVLAGEVDALRNDPFAIEKVGREKFGMIKPGEKVYRFVPPEDSE